MKIITKTKNLELTESLETFVEKKVGGLRKFAKILQDENGFGKNFAELFIEIEKETRHHRKGPYFKAEARLHLPGKTIIAISEKEDLGQAIVDLKDELQQEIKKYKSKTTELKRRKQRSNNIVI